MNTTDTLFLRWTKVNDERWTATHPVWPDVDGFAYTVRMREGGRWVTLAGSVMICDGTGTAISAMWRASTHQLQELLELASTKNIDADERGHARRLLDAVAEKSVTAVAYVGAMDMGQSTGTINGARKGRRHTNKLSIGA